MHLVHLSLTNFRNFARLDLDTPRRVILLTGRNAQGKTSLLEAIYFLATFTSFQTHAERQMIHFLAAREELAVSRLVADYRRGQTVHRLEARLILEPNGANRQRLRKEILLDGVKRPASEVVGHLSAVVFAPQMTAILEGGPEERRRYLNLALAQAIPHYARTLIEYNKALEQRNALLKLLAERGGDQNQLDFWDEALAQNGAEILYHRIAAIQELENVATRIHRRLTREAESLRLHYLPSYDPLPQPEGQLPMSLATPVQRSGLETEQIRAGFLQKLQQTRQEDIARGITSYGPHRDELRFLANGIDLGYYGSRGQIRTALLSLKIAETEWLQAKTHHCPILLLDEALAELDAQHRADLLTYLDGVEQAFLATAEPETFGPEFTSTVTVWNVEAGSVQLASSPNLTP